MELELKHLVPYLPYKSTFYVDMENFTNGNSKPELRKFTLDDNNLKLCMDYRKLALRPLSDLTREIEHNGEKFVPADILNEYDNGGIAFECDTNGYGEWYMAFFYADGLDSFSFLDFENIREKLLEWHFDIYGLIENGLAIDINTLNNEKTNNTL